MSAGPAGAGLASVSPRSRGWSLLAGLTVALACAAATEAGASPSTGIAAADAGSPALASVVKRCRTVRVKLKRHGKVVKRNGKPVFRRVRRCNRVPSPGCRFVKVKKRKNGKVVKRHGKPVYIKVERCPPKPSPPAPALQPAPGPAPGSGPSSEPEPGPTPGPGPGPQPGPADDLANRVLALAQHEPGNINLFTSDFVAGDTTLPALYPAGSAMAPATGTAPTDDEVRTQLAAYLSRRFPGDSTRVDKALALFDDPDLEAIAAEPIHRAAVAAMTGSVFEPTIDHLLNSGKWSTVRWGGVPLGVIAAAAACSEQFVFNRRYQFERFEYLIGVIGHEIMHDKCGANYNSGSEETILHALTAMTYMQVLSAEPELAHGDTELARAMNDHALLLINSREAGSPNSEIYAPTGLGVAPGSPEDAVDFWIWKNAHLLAGIPAGGETVAPVPLRTIVQNILTAGTPVPDPLNFNQATAELFENLNDNWLTDTQRAQISVLLQLVTVDEIAQATGLGQQQIIDTLGLQPYLDAIGS